MKAILLPSIDSVNYYIKKKFKYKNYLVCTNSSSVKLYCEYKYKINCEDINQYFDSAKRNFFFRKLLANYLKDLKYIDLRIEDTISVKLRKYVKNWVFHLYRYDSFTYYFSLFNFKHSLKNYLKKRKINKLIVIKNFRSNHIFFSNEDIIRVVKDVTNIDLIFKNIKKKIFLIELTNLKVFVKEFLRQQLSFIKRIRFFIFNFFKIKKKGNILIFEPLYEVNLNYYKKFNIYYNKIPNKKTNLFRQSKFNFHNLSDVFLNINKQSIEQKIIMEKIQKHFEINFFSFVKKLINFDTFVNKYKIKLCVWGLPPIHANEKVLYIKYLQNKKISVVGFQHGGIYNDMSQDDMHTLSDYHYCDKFFCYKKNELKIDIKRIKNLARGKRISIGSLRVKKILANKNVLEINKKKTILFPISHWQDNFAHSMGETSSDIVKRQEMIIKFLRNLKIKTIIKLHTNTTKAFREINYPGFYLSKFFQNKDLLIEDKLSLQEAINYHKPELLILERISTPFYETIINNFDIICFDSKYNKLKKNVRELLKKRVYIASSDKQFLNYLKKFEKDKLKNKRNKIFLNNYLL